MRLSRFFRRWVSAWKQRTRMFSVPGLPSEYYADENETIFLFSNAYGAQIDEDYSTTEVQLEEVQSDQILNQRQGIQSSKFLFLWKISQKFLRKICSKCISMVILTKGNQNSRKTVRPNKTRYIYHWCPKKSTDVGLEVSRSIISLFRSRIIASTCLTNHESNINVHSVFHYYLYLGKFETFSSKK